MLLCSQNELEKIPAHLSAFTNLKQLAISGNHLSKLPDAVADIKNLQRLDCAGNALDSLPPALGSDQPGLQHVCGSLLSLFWYFVLCCMQRKDSPGHMQY